ncbi:MAG: ABC transporter permease [Euryarchaeota archaeon]|nr:ABC transporter permease [Euryarchaeota archaeon]MDE1835167.1 ABC transporter permease [Euryarchaeota archaeon]MDE1880422.1 ABC transporter permease [Euryarchaeota archaeon]MDE2045709.1 ABC transporter permease [Thermoplasmata archaeon]
MTTEPLARPALRPSFWRTFWVNALFAPRTSLSFMRIDFIVGQVFILSFTQMLFFAYVAELAKNPTTPVSYVVIGNAVATMTYATVFAICGTTDSEKNAGTMEHLLVSPANRIALYLGRGVVPLLIALATVTVSMVYAVDVFHAPFAISATFPVAVSLVLTVVAMVGFGLLLAGVALWLRSSNQIANIFLFIGFVLAGANFPLSYLPVPLQWAGELLPLTWGIASLRAALAGASGSTVLFLWGMTALEGGVAYAMALGLWQVFERQATRTGSIVRF